MFHEPVTIWPGTPTLDADPQRRLVWHRTCAITVELDVVRGDRGVLVAHGDQGGGYPLEVDDEQLWFVHNDGHGRTDPRSTADARAWAVTRSCSPSAHPAVVAGRSVPVDGVERVADIDRPMLWPMAPFTGIDIGIDRGSPVDWAAIRAATGRSRSPGRCTGCATNPASWRPMPAREFVDS